jgi:iron(III) transport system ATP-binding protein
MTSVTVQGIAKSFGGRQVLGGVDLDVPPGNLTAVLGPSGCGKTTLLRIIAGFVHPDAGVVRLGGRPVVGAGHRTLPPQQRRVGYVPQEGALFPHLDVGANIMFGLPRGLRRGPRLADMLNLVELPVEVASRYPHELSGGQQQRVALARALAPDPAVVLLDEPFSSLDASLREGTGRAVARALHAAGATAVLVTHDQAEALSLADQVAVMRDGRLAQVATPPDLYRSPADAAVATFVGRAAVLPGRVTDGTAQCALGAVTVASRDVEGDALIVVRPEQITMSDRRDGLVSARVADVTFYGHDTAVHLELLPSGPAVVARIFGVQVPERGAVVSLRVSGPVTVFASP